MTTPAGAADRPGAGKLITIRDFAEIDPELCDGCGECLPNCAEGALEIADGQAVLSASLCDGLGACLDHCPKGALRIVKRRGVPFDGEKALAHMGKTRGAPPLSSIAPEAPAFMPSPRRASLPIASIGVDIGFSPARAGSPVREALSNWPEKLALAPPKAPFWSGEVVVWAADCASVAGEEFRSLFLGAGQPLVIGCPKLGDKSLYEKKMSAILSSNPEIRELRLPIMSVPCCQGLWRISESALAISGREDVSLRGWVFSPDGSVLERDVAIGGPISMGSKKGGL